MKYSLSFLLAYFAVGCSPVQVHLQTGRFTDQNGAHVILVGNPRIVCYRDTRVVADGIFVRDYYDGSILVDEFGKRFVHVFHPDCDLNPKGLR